ncbi:MAG: ornithine cyclodeaminase family protein [Planctomycetaceae bacterium]
MSPTIRVLTSEDVESLLDPDELVDALASAMADLSAGRASMPNRIAAEVPERDAFLAAMPAYLPSVGALTTKLVSVFPHNRDVPSHQAVLLCVDAATGTPTALMDATSITAARTAAGSALATRLLAREDARTLAVIGTGVQARAHLRAVPRVRPFDRVLVAGRDHGKARALAAEATTASGLAVEAAPSVEEAVRAADVVCACTHAEAPVVRRTWLRPGAHVTSVGFNSAGAGEIDLATVRDALVVVESRASALAPPPAGAVELVRPIADGLLDDAHVQVELGELVAGTAEGRTTEDQVTLYKSVGVAVQDAAAAALVLARAQARGTGTDVAI